MSKTPAQVSVSQSASKAESNGAPPQYSNTSTVNHTSPSGSSSTFKKGHYSRPSEELAAHDRLTRKDSRARKTIPRDQIDNLDDILGSYHHEGPFDATLASRQIPGRAPIDAVKYTNSLALHHTPSENINRSLHAHEPLDGTAGHGPGYVGVSERPGEASASYDFEHVGDLPDRQHDDEDEDDGGDMGVEVLDGRRGEYGTEGTVPMKRLVGKKDGVRGKGKGMGAGVGIVEYDPSLDATHKGTHEDEDEDEAGIDELDALNLGGGGSGSSTTAEHGSGLLSGLKKRLSIKKRA